MEGTGTKNIENTYETNVLYDQTKVLFLIRGNFNIDIDPHLS